MGRVKLFAAIVLWLISASSAPSAVEELAQLQKQAHAAHMAGDKAGYLDAALKVRILLNDAPNAMEATARAYAEDGESEHALAALNEFAAMGQADDTLLAGTDKAFVALHYLPAYKSILEHFRQNKTAVASSELATKLADAGLVPEDIDFDPQSKSFLITSVLEKRIVRVSSSGQSSAFASSPGEWPMLAIKVDAKRNRVWATEVALDGFSTAPKSDWGRSAVLCFDLNSGALRMRIEGPMHSALGDMALTEAGVPIVSDGDGGGVYRVEDGRLVLIKWKDFISPQTPALIPGRDLMMVPDYVRGIGILDLKDGQVRWLNRDGGAKVALNGVDGLYYVDGAIILTQNGTLPERVVRMNLDRSQTKVVSEDVIERATATLGDPTHGVVIGDWFYYIANSGWNVLDEHGDVKAGEKLSPGMVMRFRLR
jgi:sugar lactone lactonase YvrE